MKSDGIPIRLLLVEDDESDAKLVMYALRKGGFAITEHRRVSSRDAMRAALDEQEWDAIVSDYSLPGFGARDALALVKERGLDLPFIIVSGALGEEDAVAAMRAGAHDYLMKDRLARLAPTLDRELQDVLTRREREAAEEEAGEAQRQREIAEAANQAKSVFLANASHELRTPLNAIIGFSEILTSDTREPLTARQREYLEHVLMSGRHLLMLINDILDLSKVEAGKMDLALSPTSIAEVARLVLETVSPLAEKNGVRLTSTVPEKLPLISADAHRLRQVLYNLLSNALKFTPSGGTVVLAGKVIDARLEVSVRDSGVGIREEDLPRLFLEFTQLTSTRDVNAEGTGLGLALTKKLVELHGGTITVASTYGEGSTFTVQFPIEPEQLVEDAPISPHSQHEATGNGTRILVVEDDGPSRRLACDVLRMHGYEIIEASNIDEALAALNEAPPALVLTDIRFPGGGGERVLREVRSNPLIKNIPVLATTAHAMRGDKEKLIAMGFDAYVSKPIDTRRLGHTVESFLVKI
ncbi:MAG: response regulator [Polyangiaceae bacterium]